MPDFYTASVTIPVGYGIAWNPSISIDRHYQIYGSLLGVSVPGNVPGGSINAGWLLQRCKPTAQQTNDYLTSWGGSVTAYLPPPYPFGGGIGHSSGGTAILLGGGFPPGVNVSGGYSHRIY